MSFVTGRRFRSIHRQRFALSWRIWSRRATIGLTISKCGYMQAVWPDISGLKNQRGPAAVVLGNSLRRLALGVPRPQKSNLQERLGCLACRRRRYAKSSRCSRKCVFVLGHVCSSTNLGSRLCWHGIRFHRDCLQCREVVKSCASTRPWHGGPRYPDRAGDLS